MVTYEMAAEAAGKLGLVTEPGTKYMLNASETAAIHIKKSEDGASISKALEEMDEENLTEFIADAAKELDKLNPRFNDVESDEWKELLRTAEIQPLLINAEANGELLEKVPHRMFYDLALIYRVVVAREGKNLSTILVQNDNMAGVVSEADLYGRALALIREESRGIGIAEYFGSLFSAEFAESEMVPLSQVDTTDDMGMLVSNRDVKFGAVSLLLFDLGEVDAESDFVLLPSSVHEIMAFKVLENSSPGMFAHMVYDVNQNQVGRYERLSNSVYYYDAKERKMSVYHFGEPLGGMDEPEYTGIPPFLEQKNSEGDQLPPGNGVEHE